MENTHQNMGNQGNFGAQPPKNWLVESILVTLFCCLPLGVVGIVYAAGVEGKFARGDVDGAFKSAQTAKTMVLISAVSGIVGLVIYFVFFGGMMLLSAAGV
ncbi:CD225/dispanin family protein [Chryseobacterium sp. MFBS3-17]|uniref:CD225/dispanin family protein n=1 Tax=Chryseobacterium sp. MFBS3-17 TaxID=2886689 RepID=UPI001D0E2B2F|nr:CD225/dispanin family protein [Chryseobacterium sp. MFBS3-17]MCC2589386.1 CD225/dispanin family protein [Chryseobacterium sp. MFBS3-17]